MEARTATWNEHRDVVGVSRSKIRKAKAHLELNLVRNVKDNKQGFFKYINDTRPTTKWRSNPGEGTQKKADIPNAFCASVFNDKTTPRESQTQVTRKKEWWKEDIH